MAGCTKPHRPSTRCGLVTRELTPLFEALWATLSFLSSSYAIKPCVAHITASQRIIFSQVRRYHTPPKKPLTAHYFALFWVLAQVNRGIPLLRSCRWPFALGTDNPHAHLLLTTHFARHGRRRHKWSNGGGIKLRKATQAPARPARPARTEPRNNHCVSHVTL